MHLHRGSVGKNKWHSGRTNAIVFFRMLLLAVLSDNNSMSLVQCNFTGALQFGI